MAVNTAHANGGVLIFSGECIIIYSDNVEFHVDGNPMPLFKGKKKGRVYLTSHRVIFNSRDPKDQLQSFSMPFHSMTSVELEQPVFGANYIKGKVKADDFGANWTGEARFKLQFMHGGAIEFGQALLSAGRLASRFRPSQPPPYTPYDGNYYPAPPPAYAPPAQGYGFAVPSHVFPDQPPANSVYAMQAPPPYPGVNSPPYVPPAQAPATNGQAYYDPGNPGQVYVPPQPNAPPPSYEDVGQSKKMN